LLAAIGDIGGHVNLLTPRRRKRAFICQLPQGAKVLDVGCGTGSPLYTKSIRPDVYYVGVDVADYHQTEQSKTSADEYILCTPETFDQTIAGLGTGRFDAVISNHNLEHCDYPGRVLHAMCNVLRPGGQMFLGFPCEASVSMPSRQGTLNFYDDPTHRAPPIWKDVLRTLSENGMAPAFAAQRYRPWGAFVIGLAFEPFVAPRRRQAPKNSTWALYGMESIIWAEKVLPGLRDRVHS
jgi:SAM-dependent methyltransferase